MAGTFNQSLQCTQDVFIDFQAPSPPVCPGHRRQVGKKRKKRQGQTFRWRTGWWCKTQQLTLLLAAHVRHGLIWSSLPLPWDLFVHQLDKPQIFFTHSDPMSFGMWCYFYLHLTHLCSIFITPLSSNPPLSPIAPLFVPVNPLILCNSESSYSFYF